MPDAGSAQAIHRAGLQLYKQQQYARAYAAFNEAAASSYPPSLRMLGLMYRRGTLVPQDIGRARELWEQAAAHGDGYATGFLGQLLLHGTRRHFGGFSNPRQALRGAGLIFFGILDAIIWKKLTWED